MASKIVFLFVFAITQVLGHTSIGNGNLVAARSLSSSSSSSQSFSQTFSSSGSSSGGYAGGSLQEIQQAQADLQSNLKQQTGALSQAQQLYEQQVTTWYFQSPELGKTFTEVFSTVSGLMKQTTTYIQGAERLLDAYRQSKSAAQNEWIQRIRKLQNLAQLSLNRVSGGIAIILRNISEISEDQKVYAEAKSQQLAETKAQMDAALEQLLRQTIQVGEQTSTILSQAINEWSTMLRTHLGAQKAEPAIARLQEVCKQTLFDLERLRPEDIEAALSDAHRTIEDVKGMFYSSGVPPVVVRQSVNHVQLAIFANLTRARSLHN